MTDDASLGQLEARHDTERAEARHRLDTAEELLANYRSQITRIQDDFHQHATQQGISEDPEFRSGFQRVSELADQNIGAAMRQLTEWEEEFFAMTRQHDEERERFLGMLRQQ